ncbi:MAG: ATPase [Bacteroidetes bacterium]|nr:ATPase [Bacteroidota bacterium]
MKAEAGAMLRPNYDHAIQFLENQGKKHYGSPFAIHSEDLPVIRKLLAYFLNDEVSTGLYGIKLDKGILLSGPVGCGKTSLMNLLRLFLPVANRYIIKSCRDISFEFIRDGYDVVHRYSTNSFHINTHEPKTYCFDDLGTENNLKFYGNECNIMAEILLSRYDQFVSRKLVTHITTNLSASEMEELYGNRVRSRLREQFNLIAFDKITPDKRK